MAFPPGPRLAVSPPALTFLSVEGGVQRLDLPLTVANEGVTAMNWTITPSPPAPWLTVAQPSGTAAPGESIRIVIKVSPVRLTRGAFTTDLQIAGEGATYSPQTVAVTFLNTAEPPVFAPVVGGGG